MQTFQVLLTLTLWYGLGALAARSMIHRGHDPMPWIYLAWIAGAVTVLIAAAVTVHHRWAAPPPARSAPDPDRIPG